MYNTDQDEGDDLMDNEKERCKTGGVMNGLHVWSGADTDIFNKVLEGKEVREITLEEARRILDRALGDKCFSDYIRMERDGL